MSRLTNKNPYLEWVASHQNESFRWHTHDFPCPIARWNYHPEHEIHLIRSSTGKAFIGDYIGEFGPGCLMAVGPNLPHHWVSDLKDGEVVQDRDVVLQFDASCFMRIATIFPEAAEITSLLNTWHRGVQFQGKTARRGAMLMERIGRVHGFHRLLLFLELVRRLAQSSDGINLASTDYAPNPDENSPKIVQDVMIYILDNFKDAVSLSRAAEITGMSESTFSRFFKRNIGINFVNYVRKLRISHACKILSDTDMPITDVCFEVGYSNISNFNRHFLSEKSMTPSRYRRISGKKFMT